MSRDFDAANEEFLDAGATGAINVTGTQITLTAWVNPETTDFPFKIISKWQNSPPKRQYLLAINSSDLAQVAVVTDAGTEILEGTTSINSGSWYHIGGA